ncbi:arf-GAP with dual PH domain-containing protein 1-like [Osmerus mordax]|uniref:arf-GAP with dual PH domain-containing protein 1-like n=1 Tax=Osmerus mordax TaxID=8014 RepID=UPI0035105D89
MSSEQDKNKYLLKELLGRPGNGSCADCGAADTEWASYTLGVFVCPSCAGLHGNIPNISSVKSVLRDSWSNTEVEFMASTGNDAAKAKYEQKVPAFYYRPTHSDCQLLREQWIRARYDRNEFVCLERQEPYSAEQKIREIFQISVLQYYTAISRLLLPYFLKEMVDWFNAIRAARFHYLQVAFPGAHDADLVPKLTRKYIKEGYMEKTGPKHTEGFKKRWFTMDDRRLMYFKDPLDAYARGEVFIGSGENSYTVLPGLPPLTQGYHWQFGITIVTPDRKFLFACATEVDQREWMAAFQTVINRPMLPQEYAVEAHFKHKP